MTTTELEDLRQTWKALDRRLAIDASLRWDDIRDRRTSRARASLRPLALGQFALAGLGIAVLLLGASAWIDDRGNPAVFASGIVLHAYGLLALIAAGSTLARIRAIDYAAPVVVIQARLESLRRWYVGWSRFVGLAWWLLWIPVSIALIRPGPVPLQSTQTIWLAASIAVGLVGLAGTWVFYRWLRRPARADLRRRLEAGEAGESLLRAQAEVLALRDSEKERDQR